MQMIGPGVILPFALRAGAMGGVDLAELVFEEGFAFVVRGLERGIAHEQPTKFNPFT